MVLQSSLFSGIMKDLAWKRNTIDVWIIAIDTHSHLFENCLRFLGSREMIRLEKFVFEQDRVRFAISHGALRSILSAYTDVSPAKLVIERELQGKPVLTNFPNLGFNLSHSGNYGLVAVGAETRVGVDIEEVREVNGYIEIARRQFSAAEIAHLNKLQGFVQRCEFFRLWTRKEAFLKGTGSGLTKPSNLISMVIDGCFINELDFPGQSFRTTTWQITELDIFGNSLEDASDTSNRKHKCKIEPAGNWKNGYKAALVYEGEVRNVRIKKWDVSYIH